MAKAQVERMWIHVNDELQPQVGSGQRLVDVVVGWKWVYVKEANLLGTRKRVKRSTWERLVA